jgi:type III pantothenate kinase
MSVRLVTTPWFTKNLAAGWVDTCGRSPGADRADGTDGAIVPHRDTRIIAALLLAIDIGNTNITVGLFRSGTLALFRRAATDPTATADEIELVLTGLLGLDDATFADVGAIACASVVPPLTAAVESVARRRDRPLTIAGPGTVPVPVRVDRPGEVGADRLVNALAAARLHGTPAVVVDLGTATSFDCVGADGAYVGGAFAPGLELGLEALAARTAKLPRIELRSPDRAIGRDTVSAMQAGTVFGYQALVSGLLVRIRRELADATEVEPQAIKAILTGGLSAAPWAADLDGIDAIDPELTLRGLAILHAEVTGGELLELGLP